MGVSKIAASSSAETVCGISIGAGPEFRARFFGTAVGFGQLPLRHRSRGRNFEFGLRLLRRGLLVVSETWRRIFDRRFGRQLRLAHVFVDVERGEFCAGSGSCSNAGTDSACATSSSIADTSGSTAGVEIRAHRERFGDFCIRGPRWRWTPTRRTGRALPELCAATSTGSRLGLQGPAPVRHL